MITTLCDRLGTLCVTWPRQVLAMGAVLTLLTIPLVVHLPLEADVRATLPADMAQTLERTARGLWPAPGRVLGHGHQLVVAHNWGPRFTSRAEARAFQMLGACVHYRNWHDETGVPNDAWIAQLNLHASHLIGVGAYPLAPGQHAYLGPSDWEATSIPPVQLRDEESLSIRFNDDQLQQNHVRISALPSGWRAFAGLRSWRLVEAGVEIAARRRSGEAERMLLVCLLDDGPVVWQRGHLGPGAKPRVAEWRIRPIGLEMEFLVGVRETIEVMRGAEIRLDVAPQIRF